MRAATRERMISIMATIMFGLVIRLGFLVPKAAAHSDKYSKAKGLPPQSELQSGPTERPHPGIKSRLTTTQSRHLLTHTSSRPI
jgi:hypothetical protein